MRVSLGKLERAGRYVMSAIAVLSLAAWGAFELGWIATMPSYKNDAWYLVGGNANFVVTSEYADEASCRRAENASSICRSGKILTEDVRRQPSGS